MSLVILHSIRGSLNGPLSIVFWRRCIAFRISQFIFHRLIYSKECKSDKQHCPTGILRCKGWERTRRMEKLYEEELYKSQYSLHGVIQEEMSIFWKVIISVIVRRNIHRNMCLILSGYRVRAVYIYKQNASVMVNKEREIKDC